MIRNIVVGHDETRTAQVAVEQAVDIAEATEGRVHLVIVTQHVAPAVDLAVTGDVGGFGAPVSPPAIPEYASPEDRLAQDELDRSAYEEATSAVEQCEKAGVAHTVSRLYGNPADRLVQRGMLADLLVVARGSVGFKTEGARLGMMARQVLLRAVTPTLLCDVDYVPLREGLLLYEPTEPGGRTLARAGELCSYLNMSLTVVVAHPDRHSAERIMRDACTALRSYHVEVECVAFSGSAADAVRTEATQRKAGLVVMPQPRRPVWSWQTPSALGSATSLPGAMVMVVP
jgi:nucleotide-binding universal stress UspA family protein